MEGYCSTSQSPQWAVVPTEEEEYPFVELSSLVCHSEGSEFYPLANLLQTFLRSQ
jgi:hypothetical protein